MSKDSARPSLAQVPEWLATGRRQLQQGKLNEAERTLRAVIDVAPRTADALQLLGIVMFQRERPTQGIEFLKKAVAAEPNHVEALTNLGAGLQMLKRHEEALECFAKSCELEPYAHLAWNNRGFTLGELGRPAEGLPFLQNAVALEPRNPEYHFNLANLLRDLGRGEDALAQFREAIKLAPTYGEAHNNLGALLLILGRPEEAERTFRMALQVGFRTGQVLSNLGISLHHQGRTPEALETFQHAIQTQRTFLPAYHELGSTLHSVGRLGDSIVALEHALKVRPNDLETIRVRSRLLQEAGRYLEARKSLVATGDRASLLLSALMQPSIAQTTEEIIDSRAYFSEVIAQTEGLEMRNPFEALRMTPFFLAYQGLPEIDLVQSFAARVRSACPALDTGAPHIERPRDKSKPIRLGVATSHFRNHTIAKIYAEIFARMDKERFEVIFFDASEGKDEVNQKLRARFAKTVSLANSLDLAQWQIEREELDILFYPELGMNNFLWYLAQIRLARKQVTTWGHPMTSGSPNIDAFLTSEHLETPSSDRFYGEKLLRTKHANTYFVRPEPPAEFTSHAKLGLPEGKRLYGIPQSLFKLHPDFDVLLGRILDEDPNGILVLNNAVHQLWEPILRERFARTMPGFDDRIVILPRLAFPDFLSLVHHCDVLLDPIHFGGGTTTLEFFAMSRPVVTFPGEQLRSRITQCFYQEIGMTNLIAKDGEEYVQLALRLARDQDFQHEMRRELGEKAGSLYSNEHVVQETEDTLAALLED
ncbi:MAG: tetratricopeptide repeat protein [Fimbriimonas sp.]